MRQLVLMSIAVNTKNELIVFIKFVIHKTVRTDALWSEKISHMFYIFVVVWKFLYTLPENVEGFAFKQVIEVPHSFIHAYHNSLFTHPIHSFPAQ